jgi:hypothetical protein
MNLENDLTLLINESHQETWSGFDVVQHDAARYGLNKAQVMKWRNPGEPAFVSNLIERPFGHCKLSAIVHAHLAPLGICAGAPLVSGVFIHQKPKARIKGSRTKIELGDLLFVRQHFRSRHASPEGRAMLLQAKSGQFPCTGLLKGNEAKQFALYAGWTSEFVFPHGEIGSPPDGSAWWNFSKGLTPAPEQSGLYGLVSNSRADAVDVSFPGGCSWAVGMAAVDPTGGAPEVKGAWSLAFALKGLLMGNFGRAWNDRPDSNDHWSHFVIRVLEAAARWQYPSQRIGKANLPRRRDALSFAQELAGSSRRP